MIYKTAESLKDAKGELTFESWTVQRFLHQEDGMGFTLSDAVFEPGTDKLLWYKHHVEACYCIEGEGTVEVVSTGTTYPIKPGVLYAVDKHERHRLRAVTRMRLICIFVPALAGGERHDDQGAFARSG